MTTKFSFSKALIAWMLMHVLVEEVRTGLLFPYNPFFFIYKYTQFLFFTWWRKRNSLQPFIFFLHIWLHVSLNKSHNMFIFILTVPRRWMVPLRMCGTDTGDKIQRKMVLSNLQTFTPVSMILLILNFKLLRWIIYLCSLSISFHLFVLGF